MPFQEQDFDQLFQAFNASSQGGSIREVYSVMPYLKQSEIKLVNDALFFCRRYGLDDVEDYLKDIVSNRKHNRSLGMFPSFKNLLKYMTLEEKIKSVKVNGTPPTGSDNY